MPKSEKEINLERDLADSKAKNEALEKKVSTFDTNEKSISDKDDELKAKDVKIAEFAKKEEAANVKAAAAEVDAFCSDLEKEKMMTPAMKEFVVALVGPDKSEYTIKDKKYSKQEAVKEILKLFKASSEVNEVVKTEGGKSEDESVDVKISEYMKEHKVNYTAAFKACDNRKLEE